MENGSFEDVFTIKIRIFHCYVRLPEGKWWMLVGLCWFAIPSLPRQNHTIWVVLGANVFRTKLPVANLSGNDRPLVRNIKGTGRWGPYKVKCTIDLFSRWLFWSNFSADSSQNFKFRRSGGISISIGTWFQIYFSCPPSPGGNDAILTSILFKWVAQPPPRYFFGGEFSRNKPSEEAAKIKGNL